MMQKFRLLLLDTNIVFELFRLGIWETFIDRCDVHLAQTVVDEAKFYEDENGCRHEIDLDPCRKAGGITVFDVPLDKLTAFIRQFDGLYIDSLEAGEAESLAWLFGSQDKYLICSADKIVYRILGNCNRGDQGVSLEEILNQIGLGRKLARQYGAEYHKEWTTKGAIQGFQGLGRSDDL
jgi:hypothetical protein